MSKNFYDLENQERKSLAESIKVGAMCRVEKFDPDAMTVDVQPLSKVLDGGVYRTPPQVIGVPVSLIRGGGFVLRPWYAAGDVGVIVYLDHDIDRIVEAGQECQPNTERNHSGEDAFFIGAFVPAYKKLTGLPAQSLVMATEGGNVYLAITQSGIEIKGNMTITGNITQKGRTDVTDDVTAQGKSLASHTHTCPHGGTSGPN